MEQGACLKEASLARRKGLSPHGQCAQDSSDPQALPDGDTSVTGSWEPRAPGVMTWGPPATQEELRASAPALYGETKRPGHGHSATERNHQDLERVGDVALAADGPSCLHPAARPPQPSGPHRRHRHGSSTWGPSASKAPGQAPNVPFGPSARDQLRSVTTDTRQRRSLTPSQAPCPRPPAGSAPGQPAPKFTITRPSRVTTRTQTKGWFKNAESPSRSYSA